jgi:hypothetical protein
METSQLSTDIVDIKRQLKIGNLTDEPYIVNRVSEACLSKFVELTFRNKFGDPLYLLPFQRVMLHMMWSKKFPMVLACRGAGKTYMLAIFCLLKCLLVPGTRIVVVSGGFRQAKFVFQYIDEIIRCSPILQEAIRKYHPGNEFGVKYATDKVYIKVGWNTDVTGIPIGDGSKVRGLRATTLICDEVASIEDKVFDTAIGPFLSVQSDPAEAVIVRDFIERLRRLGAKPAIIKMIENYQKKQGNQLILAGTATYQFNHFFRRYQAYSIFAKSGGDKRKIKEGLQIQTGETGAVLTEDMLTLWSSLYKEYAIFQLPFNGMPGGFLDDAVVATHRATMDPIIFGHEYQCRFSKDTNGFFPRSIVDDSSPGKDNPDEVHYELYGDPHAQYVMGLDPARWNDNFGLVVLKLSGGAARCVYVESWNKAKFQESVVRIREVMRRFPNIVRIAMDKGGGGDTIQELLANAKVLKEGEKPIIEIEPSDEYKAIPNAVRILEMVNFHTWSSPANHAMKSDIILRRLLFPKRLDDDVIMHRHAMLLQGKPFDLDAPKDIQIMEHLNNLLYGVETEDGEVVTHGVYKEVMFMVDELCTITQSVTEKGTETFGLPRLSDQPEGLDIRRRDRYSALLLASHAARAFVGHGHNLYQPVLGGSPQMILGNAPQIHLGGGFQPMRRHGGVAY